MLHYHIVALACKTPEITVLGDTKMAAEGSRNAEFVTTFLLCLDSNAAMPLLFTQNANKSGALS